MAYPTVAFKPTSQRMGSQPIAETSTTQRHGLGEIITAFDYTYGAGQFIYLLGAASTAAGDLVCFNSKTGATVRTTHAGTGANGPCAVAMSANVANQYGWYQIEGSGPVKAGTALANSPAYLTSTAGQIDDAVVAGDRIDGFLIKADTSGGFATCQFDSPSIDGGSDASVLSYTDGSATTGDVTINTRTGKCKCALGAATLTVTNSLVTSASLIIAWVAQAAPDATLGVLATNPGTGSFTITGEAVATAATIIGFQVLN